jgi:uncharacterized membrane protein
VRYIDRVLQPGEKVIESGRVHWIIYVPAVAVLLLGLLALIAAIGNSSAPVWMFLAWFTQWTTEIDVTNRRIVYKRRLKFAIA